jgi:hypothetical protein
MKISEAMRRFLAWLWSFLTEGLSFGLLVAGAAFVGVAVLFGQRMGDYGASMYFRTGIAAAVVGLILLVLGFIRFRGPPK